MKIIILGAGQMGASVTQHLVSEDNDLTVVDTNAARLSHLQNLFDLRTVQGNGACPSVQKEAGAEDADLLVAMTSSDETNLVATQVAKKFFNIPSRIARLRTPDYLDTPTLLSDDHFAVNFTLCPERIVREHIVRLVDFPGALQVLDFAGGKVVLVAMRALLGGRVIGSPILAISKHLPKGIEARIVAIFRKDKAIFPEGDTVISEGDEVFVIAAKEHIRTAMLELHRLLHPVRNIMIVGGGNIGLAVARALEKDYRIKLIENDRTRCEHIAKRLPNTLVLHGDGTDENFLKSEGVGMMDMLIALTHDEETNIMSALLAKHMECPRVISLINRDIYAELIQGERIDIAISPAQVSMGTLLAAVRRGDVAKVHNLRRGAAEAIEIIAHGDHETSQVVGRPIGDLKKIPGSYVGALVRAETGEVIMGHKSVQIQEGDHLIIFCQDKKVVHKVESLFSVSLGFL